MKPREIKGGLRVGLVGCGTIARRKHLPALKKLPQAAIVGFYDLNRANAESLCGTFGDKGAAVYPSAEALFDAPDIDAVYILTPNTTHAELAVAALEKGKHVMCEKPLAPSGQEALRIVETAERRGKKLTVAYQNRFRADVQFLRALSDKGQWGEIYHAKAHAIRKRAAPNWGGFTDKSIQGGGALIDIGSHSIDLALWLMDNFEPQCVVGRTYAHFAGRGSRANRWGDWDPARFSVEDSAFGFAVMKNGACLSIEAAWTLNHHEEHEACVTLFGTKAGVDMRNGIQITGEIENAMYTMKPEFQGDAVRNLTLEVDRPSPSDLEAHAFIDSILNDTEPVVTPRQALAVTRIIEAIYISDRTRRPVLF